MDEYKRLVIKRESGVPTVPVSLDARNGDWITTDIYEGEMYQDIDTGKVYTRDTTGITTADGSVPLTRYKANLSQTGTNAPVENTIFQNDIAGVWSYVSTGTYHYTKVGAFTGLTSANLFISARTERPTSNNIYIQIISNDVILLQTYNSADVLANAILSDASILIEF